MHQQRSTARAALAAFAFGLAFATAPLPAPATPAAIEIPVTAKVSVKVPGKYFFKFELIDLDDGGAIRWSEQMDLLGKKREITANRLTHTLGSLWKSYGSNTPLDPALFEHQLWLRVSSYRNGAWVPCSGNLRLSIVPYAVWSALSAGTGDEVITTYMIQDGAVTGGKLADGAVSAGKIADGAVTVDKLGYECSEGETLFFGPLGWACGTCLTCRQGDFLSCYHAPFATLNVGPCRPGVRACTPEGTGFDAACVGEVLPQPEACNEADDDCDGIVDNPTTGDGGVLLYRDADADSFGDSAASRTFCGAEHVGWTAVGEDCRDNDPLIFPGALERCDCKDNDCDTAVDEECMVDGACTTPQISTVMLCLVNCGDDDGCRMGCFEGLGTCGTVLLQYFSCLSENEFPCMPLDFLCADQYCDTTNLVGHPGCACGATQTCGDTPDGVGICRKGTQACVDGEWAGACVGAVYPGHEICDNDLDDDCDGDADEPGGIEICDGEDNDCDGDVDVDAVGAVACIIPPGPACDTAAKSTFDACVAGCGDNFECVTVCGAELQECDGERAKELGDCAESSCVSPGPEEQPLFDPTCFTSDLCKAPYDLLFTGEPGECLHGATQSCGTDVGPCELGTQTCDHGRWGGCVGGVGPVDEICGDEVDNDCNGTVDDGAADADDDGVSFCDGDCDDGDNTVYLGAPEICDGRDNDCDGRVDGELADASCPDDDDLCTSEPYCEEGQCLLPAVCNDWIECTDDSCNPETGGCTYANNPSHPGCAQCGDGVCSGEEDVNSCFEDCDPCLTMNCDDGIACTTDSCDSWIASCTNEPDDSSCSDGDFCDGIETCVPGSGCQEGAPIDCDDGIACTTDSCTPPDGACSHETLDVLCDDNDVCNGSEFCTGGAGCLPGTPLSCDDTNACNGSETCDPAVGCLAGVPVVCDDGIDCTTDECNPSTGGCNPPWPDDESCFDSDPCTVDTCNPAAGCSNTLDIDLCPECGDGICSGGEDSVSCPGDCPL